MPVHEGARGRDAEDILESGVGQGGIPGFGREEAVAGAPVGIQADLGEALDEAEEELQVQGRVEGVLEAFTHHQAAARFQAGAQVPQGGLQVLGHVQHIDAHDGIQAASLDALVTQGPVQVQRLEAEGQARRGKLQLPLGPAQEGGRDVREAVLGDAFEPALLGDNISNIFLDIPDLK